MIMLNLIFFSSTSELTFVLFCILFYKIFLNPSPIRESVCVNEELKIDYYRMVVFFRNDILLIVDTELNTDKWPRINNGLM